MVALGTAISSRVLHTHRALRRTSYAPSYASCLCWGDHIDSPSVGMPPRLSPRPPCWVRAALVAFEPLGSSWAIYWDILQLRQLIVGYPWTKEYCERFPSTIIWLVYMRKLKRDKHIQALYYIQHSFFRLFLWDERRNMSHRGHLCSPIFHISTKHVIKHDFVVDPLVYGHRY